MTKAKKHSVGDVVITAIIAWKPTTPQIEVDGEVVEVHFTDNENQEVESFAISVIPTEDIIPDSAEWDDRLRPYIEAGFHSLIVVESDVIGLSATDAPIYHGLRLSCAPGPENQRAYARRLGRDKVFLEAIRKALATRDRAVAIKES